MTIRTATSGDAGKLHQIYLKAFDESERELVADLAVDLLRQESEPETIHLVADKDGELLGHVAFSPVYAKRSGQCIGYTMAPLAVDPGFHKQGIGSQLVREGLKQMNDRNVSLVLVYGDPAYYGRFGFAAELAESYIPPYKLQYPFGWLAIALNDQLPTIVEEPIECVPALSKPELW